MTTWLFGRLPCSSLWNNYLSLPFMSIQHAVCFLSLHWSPGFDWLSVPCRFYTNSVWIFTYLALLRKLYGCLFLHFTQFYASSSWFVSAPTIRLFNSCGFCCSLRPKRWLVFALFIVGLFLLYPPRFTQVTRWFIFPHTLHWWSFVISGHETTASLLSFCVLELGDHPEIMERWLN